MPMQGDAAARNAQRVEALLDAHSFELQSLEGEERDRRAAAIGAAAAYAHLLRETAPKGIQERYAFKLEFPDGRWDVREQLLPAPPRVGDLVWFGQETWQVSGYRQVPARRSGKKHEFLACTPIAA
ncbi:MAG: hypothetical protein ABUS54_00790 [Actinomycetota bacterium]